MGRDGVHRFSYNYSGDGGVVETLTATVDPDGDAATTNNLQASDDRPMTGHMFWPGLADRDGGDGTKYAVLFGDTDRDEIIVDANADDDGDDWPAGGGTEPRRVECDDNDRFDVQRSGDAAPRPVGTMEEFERALAEFLAKTPTSDAGTGACLEWADFDRARDTAEIKLWRVCS